MRIYVAHSVNFDFREELYEPLKASTLAQEHELIFPHEGTSGIFNSKELFQNDCDLVLAEISEPGTGLGIELGWADAFHIPITCIYKTGFKPSESLHTISDTFIEYSDPEDMVSKIEQSL